MAYFKSVVEGVVTPTRNGLLHAIAAGHIRQLLGNIEDLPKELGKFKQFVEGELRKNPDLVDKLFS